MLECPVNHLGRYKVGWLKAKDQTILALHHRVITHNNRFVVDHEDNRLVSDKVLTPKGPLIIPNSNFFSQGEYYAKCPLGCI